MSNNLRTSLATMLNYLSIASIVNKVKESTAVSGLDEKCSMAAMGADNPLAMTRTCKPQTEKGMKKLSLWIRLLPILFFLTYLNFTVFLFAFGPWPWPVMDATKLYIFLAFAHGALLLGYLSAAFNRPRGYYGKWRVGGLIAASLVINLLLLIPTSLSRTGSAIPNVLAGVTTSGAAYFASIQLRIVRTAPVEYIRIIMGPLLFLLLPLVIYYWQRLKWVIKGFAIFSILGYLGIYVATGTNKGIADLLLITPWLVLASNQSGFFKLNRRHKLAIIVLGLIAIFLFLWFFTSGQRSRRSSSTFNSYFPHANIEADSDNFLVRSLPPLAQSGVIGMTSYLTQGYYALYLSLDKPFVPMLGIGNSMFLYRNASKLTGNTELGEKPYPVRIEADGWDAYAAWSTIYPWLASDFSFPGTILVVFLIGRYFALAWVEAMMGSNPFAIAALAQFLIMICYFPANNQVMQTGEGLTSFYFILILWLYTRRKFIWRKSRS
jgi:hypothetical protein